MAVIGYARVSTPEQDLEAQKYALGEAGAERIYSEKKSGVGDSATRQSLDHALKALQEGDEFVATSLDRIGRSTRHLLQVIEDLKKRGVRVRTLDGFDSNNFSAHDQLVLSIRAAFAEYERAMISQRTSAAMKQAQREGRHVGRPPKVNPKMVETMQILRDQGKTIPYIAGALNVGLSTVKRYLHLQ
ncbi:recombinase family protein [Agrobacterium radiobacter]|uniref:recombinase family protein n=1 Tax=Agrobacterium radiobacter TaxID=362 RepID=UPI003CE4C7F1